MLFRSYVDMNDFLNKTESRYKKLKIQRFNKFQYKKIIKQLSIAMEKGSPVLPFYCNNSFDFNFFIKVALSNKPDVKLYKNGAFIYNTKYPLFYDDRVAKKYLRLADRNLKRTHLRLIKNNFN